MNDVSKDIRPIRRLGRDEIVRRLALNEGVARPTASDDDIRRFLDRISCLPGSTPIRSNVNVRPTCAGPRVATIHVEVDEACPETVVIDVDCVRAILEHALTVPCISRKELELLLTVRAFAGDVDGSRTASRSLGMAAGTPWSDPIIAGHGPGWKEPDDPVACAADLPFLHIVGIRGDGLTLDQCVVLDSPRRIEIDPMTMLRVMTENSKRRDALKERDRSDEI